MTHEEETTMLEQKLKILQMYYAAALADSVIRYGNEGILDKVTEQKKVEQIKGGASLAARFSVTEPKQVFKKTQDTYGCANWVCIDTDSGFEAVRFVLSQRKWGHLVHVKFIACRLLRPC